MKLLAFPLSFKGKKIKKDFFYDENVKKTVYFLFLLFSIFILFLSVYFTVRIWQSVPEKIPQFSAGVIAFFDSEKKEDQDQEEYGNLKEEDILDFVNNLIGPENYNQTAEKGEGATHLARKALTDYLKDHSNHFEITDEHKIYIEDYLVKKTGNQWLELSQELEFSKELIEEAIRKAENLSLNQLENLSQYSNLTSF